MPMADPVPRQLLHEKLLGRNANSRASPKKINIIYPFGAKCFSLPYKSPAICWAQTNWVPFKPRHMNALETPTRPQWTKCEAVDRRLPRSVKVTSALPPTARVFRFFFRLILAPKPHKLLMSGPHKNAVRKCTTIFGQKAAENCIRGGKSSMQQRQQLKWLHLTSKSISTSNSGGYEMQLTQSPFGRTGAQKLWGCRKSNNISGNNCYHTNVWVHQRHVGQCICICISISIAPEASSDAAAVWLAILNLWGYDF